MLISNVTCSDRSFPLHSNERESRRTSQDLQQCWERAALRDAGVARRDVFIRRSAYEAPLNAALEPLLLPV
jgi:uncharacterized protein YjiS (DUF1127 family)